MSRPVESARRERILVAAVTLLRQHGLKRFSQLRVAEAAGVEQGHLTYYFPRRSDLLGAVGRRYGEETVAELEVLARSGDPAGAFELVRAIVRDRARTRLWLGLLTEAEEDLALRHSLIEIAAAVRAAVALVLGRDAGDVDVELALYALWGIALGHLLHRDRARAAVTDGLIARVAAASMPAPASRRPPARARSHARRRAVAP